jgi:hypothetical protein
MDRTRFDAALRAFDAANAEDPNTESVNGVAQPRELVDARRLSEWVLRLQPNASEALQLAARCQHIRRWKIARSEFPEGRVGYLQWRTRLGRYHADEAASILRDLGYSDELIEQVRRINVKQGLHSNPDTRVMEDALCLSFIEHELEAFSHKHSEEKLVSIIRKTWHKMSPHGREVALSLNLPARVATLIQRALSDVA